MTSEEIMKWVRQHGLDLMFSSEKDDMLKITLMKRYKNRRKRPLSAERTFKARELYDLQNGVFDTALKNTLDIMLQEILSYERDNSI